MHELRCGQCNREGSVTDRIDAFWSRAAGTDPKSVSDLLNDSWATIGGVDLCPDCLTDSDRAHVARRMSGLVESAIKATDDRNVAPSPAEVAMIAYVMQLREALITWGGGRDVIANPDSAAGEASAPELTDESAKNNRREVEVAITGAFLTGCPLHIRSSSYSQIQAELATALDERNPEKGWTSQVSTQEAGTYSTGGGFSTAVHLILVGQAGDDALARTSRVYDKRPPKEHERQVRIAPGWIFTPKSMRIELYDLGVGVIDGAFKLSVPMKVGDGDLIDKLNEIVDLHPRKSGRFSTVIANTFAQLCDEATREFRRTVVLAGECLMDPWLEMDPAVAGEHRSTRTRPLARRQGAPDPNAAKSAEWGRLLWLHPVLLLTAPSDPERQAIADKVAPAFSTRLSVHDGVFVPGIGASAIITGSPKTPGGLLKLIRLHWAYFALYMEIDRGLLGLLRRFDTNASESHRLRDLEVEANDAFDSYIRVIQARARVESTLASLGGDEQAIWDSIAKVQKYNTIVGGVGKKVDALRSITDRRAQQASSAQAQRATLSLGLLAALGLVSLVIASFSYFFGAATNSGDDRNRVIPFIAGFLIALALWWWINFAKLRQRRRRR